MTRFTRGHALISLCAALLFFFLVQASRSAESEMPVGVWLDASKRIQVQIFPCEERLCGNIVWFRWPNDAQGLPLRDLKNRDPARRSRPLLGLTVLWNLSRVSESAWAGGHLYNPNDGKYYRVQLSNLDKDSLSVRIYVLFPAFGQTQVWTRIR